LKSTLRVCSRAIASLSEADAGEADLEADAGEADLEADAGEAARRAGLACRGRRRPGEADGREGDDERAAARANDMAGAPPALRTALVNDAQRVVPDQRWDLGRPVL